jgi:F0F1-type ATP synthase membrane subunit b/b'
MSKLLIGLCAAAVVVGGTIVLANQAMPGDVLYGFKLSVLETVRGALAGDGEARAMWEVSAADRRLKEAGEAAALGRLDTKAQTMLARNFDNHIERTAMEVSGLEAKGNYQASRNIATALTRILVENANAFASVQAQAETDANAESRKSLTSLSAKVQSTLTAAAMIATRQPAEVLAQ